MTEAQLQAAVVDLCKLLGVRWYHPYDSRRSVPGYPDLTLVGTRGLMFRELKTATGRLTKHQQDWGASLRRASADWDVWRPRDLRRGRVLAELRAIR